MLSGQYEDPHNPTTFNQGAKIYHCLAPKPAEAIGLFHLMYVRGGGGGGGGGGIVGYDNQYTTINHPGQLINHLGLLIDSPGYCEYQS